MSKLWLRTNSRNHIVMTVVNRYFFLKTSVGSSLRINCSRDILYVDAVELNKHWNNLASFWKEFLSLFRVFNNTELFVAIHKVP